MACCLFCSFIFQSSRIPTSREVISSSERVTIQHKMGKKSKKKQPDTRGFSTTSVLREKPPVEEETHTPIRSPSHPQEEGASSTPVSTNDSTSSSVGHKGKGTDQEEGILKESEEEFREGLTRQHISSEIIHLQKLNTINNHSNAYRGQLFPPLPVQTQISAAIPTADLLQQLITRAQEQQHRWCPLSYTCPSWNYDRAMRVLHALGGAGLSTDAACQALIATRGHDERAAAEYAILHCPPEQLPLHWCEMPPPSFTKQPVSQVESESEDAASTTSTEQDLLQVNLALHKVKEQEHFKRVQQAKHLAVTIQQENDSRLLFSKEQEVEQTCILTATDRFKELQSYTATLRNARGYLDKREKGLVDGRVRELSREMQQLKESGEVDFRLLGGEKGEKDVEEKEEKEESSGDMTDAAEKTSRETEDGGEEKEKEKDGDLLMDLFSEQEGEGEGGDSVVDQQEPIFQFNKSKSHLSPQKLLTQTVADFRTFTSVGEQQPNRYKETVIMGPLLSSTAKQLSKPKGTVFNITPTAFATDLNSARELSCLRLLYEILPGPTSRQKISQKLCPCALKQWTRWLEREASERERALRDLATQRVHAVDESLVDVPTRHKISPSVPGEDTPEVATPSSRRRVPMTLGQLQEEIATRGRSHKLALEHVRRELPVVKESSYVAALIAGHDISIICGETGSGR